MFVLNCVDGCIPSDLGTGTSAEIEEERRLLYVAMTRAKDELHLIMPQRFYVHGQHRRMATATSTRRARAVHPARDPRPVRADVMAAAGRGGAGRRACRSGRSAGADARDVALDARRPGDVEAARSGRLTGGSAASNGSA